MQGQPNPQTAQRARPGFQFAAGAAGAAKSGIYPTIGTMVQWGMLGAVACLAMAALATGFTVPFLGFMIPPIPFFDFVTPASSLLGQLATGTQTGFHMGLLDFVVLGGLFGANKSIENYPKHAAEAQKSIQSRRSGLGFLFGQAAAVGGAVHLGLGIGPTAGLPLAGTIGTYIGAGIAKLAGAQFMINAGFTAQALAPFATMLSISTGALAGVMAVGLALLVLGAVGKMIFGGSKPKQAPQAAPQPAGP